MSDLPPLPKIDGDFELMLDVFTHRTVRMSNAMVEDYGDTQRLAELGAKVFDLVTTYHLYSERPFLTAEAIQGKKEEINSDVTIDRWLQAYGLKEKLRIAPSDVAVLNDPEEMRKYFHTYIGALYIRNGLNAIQQWISKMIDPTVDIKLPNSPPQFETNFQPQQPQMHGFGQPWPGYNHQPRHHSPAPSQASSASYPPSQASSSHPPPPPGVPPPPMPASPPAMMPSSTMSLVTLALVNQTAAQRGYHVTYPAEQTGPAHQPTWTVRCCMNGTQYGFGTGKSQKQAKEEAARMAWAAMGWGPT